MARNSTIKEYVKLENRLVLLAWINSLLGYKRNRELLEDLKGTEEGFDPQGRSYIFHRLESRGEQVKIPLHDLTKYDENIRNDLQKINAKRTEPIKLRYFQYISILYSEIFLDWLFNRRNELLRKLNDFVDARNSSKAPGEFPDPKIAHTDLSKLAFWMATGSGKTLIMHFNYRQFLRYTNETLDNILLITPNEGLSEQHMEEMIISGIPCERFDLNESGLGLAGKNPVRVIEITKLVEEKRGGGVSVPVDSFEGNNLIFVDEGHKGSGGEVWRSFRDQLGQTGFTFEYSATFGQALTASKNDFLTAEYGKAIIFDYSYKYFYGDGYGKDFHILNLKEETTGDKTDTLMLGNLLSFYEQQRCHEEQKRKLKPYNIDKPLWVYVGSSVNAVYTEKKEKRSDVLTVARFLHKFLENKSQWSVKTIKKLIEGKSGLVDVNGEDVFAGKYEYLRRWDLDPERVFQDVLEKVFNSPGAGTLHILNLRGSQGELGLKVSGADDYFGLIYIGDTPSFKKLVDEDNSGIVIEEDAFSESLFEGINSPGTKITVLIGAKKFMEGWNSWRVSNMGLLNIGRKEGSEIIQLFGRGVRLRGYDFSLKRSTAIDGDHPDHIRLLETLNIFAIRANYMVQFRDYLEREGVETFGDVQLPLPIRRNETFLGKGLVLPKAPKDVNFTNDYDIIMEPCTAAKVNIDMSLKVQSMTSTSAGLMTASATAGKEQVIPKESIDLIDWESLYISVMEFKEQKGFFNLVIQPESLRTILSTDVPERLYRLTADDAVVKPRSFADRELLQEAALSIIRKYIEKFYRVCKERWDSKNMVYQPLRPKESLVKEIMPDYVVRIPKSETSLIAAVEKLINEGDKIYKQETMELPNIHFDRHLYQPLLIERGDKIKSSPPGLKESEQVFVNDIRNYFRDEASKSLAFKEIYLLRNLSKGKGVGFFDMRGFYPDFIIWIKEKKCQRIVFIEPHGMLHAESYIHDDKARLHEALPELAVAIAKRSKAQNISLDSFIVSSTSFEDLRKKYDDGEWDHDRFSKAHILFPERTKEYDYMKIIFS